MVLTNKLMILALSLVGLGLWCRWRRTTVAALLQLHVKQLYDVLQQGLLAGALAMCTQLIVQQLFEAAKLAWPDALSQLNICHITSFTEIWPYVRQSGDLLAVAMLMLGGVVVAPSYEELFFRWVEMSGHTSAIGQDCHGFHTQPGRDQLQCTMQLGSDATRSGCILPLAQVPGTLVLDLYCQQCLACNPAYIN
jgi:hypothetical protein